jgi:phage terminase small subunit
VAVLANHKHELFAQALAKGEPASTAYKNAGYSATGNSAESAAARLFRKVQVVARVAELQERAAIKAELTVLDIVRMLDEDRALARKEKQTGSAVSATLGMAKVLGFLKEKVEHSGPDGGPIEHKAAAQAEIAEMFGPTPHLIEEGHRG